MLREELHVLTKRASHGFSLCRGTRGPASSLTAGAQISQTVLRSLQQVRGHTDPSGATQHLDTVRWAALHFCPTKIKRVDSAFKSTDISLCSFQRLSSVLTINTRKILWVYVCEPFLEPPLSVSALTDVFLHLFLCNSQILVCYPSLTPR